MAALDEPDRYTFLRGGRDLKRNALEARAAWLSVLDRDALKARMEADGTAAAQRRLEAYRRRQGGGLVPGITRGGKPVTDA